MSVSLVSQPVWRVYDNSGTLAVGALVYTYQAGTSTPQATFTDATGVTPNPNPIVTNSRGEFVAWFTDGLAYKLVVKDIAGNILWTQDNLTSQGNSGLTILTDLAAADGSTLVGFEQPGGVLRTAQDKLRESVSLKDFGAHLDGVTDDSAALTAANTLAATIGASLVFEGVAHIASGVTITAPIADTLSQILSITSAAKISNGLPVRPEWWGIGNQNALDAAINSLPTTGGTVQLENATYKPNGYAYGFGGTGKYISKDHVKIVGRKMPRVAADCKSLEGGSIIQGMLLVYANNFSISDVGIDSGYTVVQTYNGGTVVAGSWGEGFECTFPNDAVKTASPQCRTLRIHNVIGLSVAPTSPCHALILGEGYTDVRVTGNAIGIYGVHGCAVKCRGFSAERIETYLNGTDGLILKSDFGATTLCGNVMIDQVRVKADGPRGTTPYIGSAGTGTGLLFNPAGQNMDEIQIGQVLVEGYPINVGATFGGNYILSGVDIESITSDQLGVAGTTQALSLFTTGSAYVERFCVGSLAARNCTIGAQFVLTQPADINQHVSLGRLEVTNATNAVDIGSHAYVGIDEVVADTCSDAVYHITGTPKLIVGKLWVDQATPATYSTANSGLAPALSNSWTQVASNDPFGVDLVGGRVGLRGLVKPGSTTTLTTLPPWAWPLSNKRFLGQGKSGSTVVAVPVLVASNGAVSVNEIAGGTSNCTDWLSLSGITFDLQA